MDDKRSFSRRQKNALYIAASGKCEMCGVDLPPGWHADHIVPYIKKGNTSLINGRALCPLCNLKKGSSMSFKDLRPFQREFVDRVLKKAQQVGDLPKRFIANVTPASGKTLASLAAGDALFEAGFIDTVIHLSPRLNLAIQMEEDSRDFIQSPLRKSMNRIEWRKNVTPLIRPPASGYATTYASLMSDVVTHVRAVQGKKFLLICDELQQLGVDYDGDNSTKSAAAVKELAQHAFMVIGMTGTPYRADNSRLLFADYSDQNEEGEIALQADVEATYRMGVVEGYLRKFEFHLFDGSADWNSLGVVERLKITEMDNGLWRVLQQPDFWKPLVDQFVEIANEQRRIVHPGLRDLIAAYNQKQAGEIQEYLLKRHHIKALKAVSDDGAEAHEALRQFKEGNHTTLVTVSMAYVGYNYPAISHILPLTAYRAGGYLSQLTARGLRVWRDIPAENQTCYMVAPNDPNMARFVEDLRNDSVKGLIERQLREASKQAERSEQMDLGYAETAALGDMTARGYHPEGDAVGQEFIHLETIRREMNIATPATQLNAFLKRATTQQPMYPPTPTQSVQLTEFEKEQLAGQKLTSLVNTLCRIGQWDHQKIWYTLTTLDGKKQGQRSLNELYRCHEIVESWIKKERHD